MNTRFGMYGSWWHGVITIAGLTFTGPFALNAQPVTSQDRTPVILNSVQGRVFMEGADRTAPVRVTLRNSQGSEVGTAMVKYDGVFAFESLVSGDYLLLIEKQDSATVARPVRIGTYASPKTVYLQIRLSADGSSTVREALKDYSRQDLPQREEPHSKVSKGALKEFQRASQENSKGNHLGAIQHLKNALRTEPKFYEAWNDLGLHYQAIEEWDQAAEAFRQAVAAENQSIKPLINLGNLYLRLNQLDPALEIFKQAIKLDPESALSHAALGKIYALKHDSGSAREHLEISTRLEPKSSREAFLLLARLELADGDTNQACQTLRTMLSFFPSDPDAYSLMSGLPECTFQAKP